MFYYCKKSTFLIFLGGPPGGNHFAQKNIAFSRVLLLQELDVLSTVVDRRRPSAAWPPGGLLPPAHSYGSPRQGNTRQAKARQDKESKRMQASQDNRTQDKARQDKARQHKENKTQARHKARQHKESKTQARHKQDTRQDKATQGKTRQQRRARQRKATPNGNRSPKIKDELFFDAITSIFVSIA